MSPCRDPQIAFGVITGRTVGAWTSSHSSGMNMPATVCVPTQGFQPRFLPPRVPSLTVINFRKCSLIVCQSANGTLCISQNEILDNDIENAYIRVL
jgi:hypothetical protein